MQGASLQDKQAVAASRPPQPHTGPPVPRRQGQAHARLATFETADRRLGYRLVGNLVQQSTDGGRTWTAVLSSGGHALPHSGGCHPARYRTVTALALNGLLPGTLFVATGGGFGPAPRNGGSYACTAATGGLYVLRPDGRGGLRRTDSLAAGLPYVQAGQGRSPRAYTLLDLIADPANPDVLYAHAALPPSGAKPAGQTPAGLYRSVTGGLYWSPAMSGLPSLGKGAVPRGTLLINPANTAIIYDVIGTTLYRSENRGGYWSAPRGIQARRWLRLYINQFNPWLVYALTDQGIFHSLDAGKTWSRFVDKGLPAPAQIRSLGFNARYPSGFYVTPMHGLSILHREPYAPKPPAYGLALALSPDKYNRVVLALHTAPRTSARLAIVRGARRTSARLQTDNHGFGYATVRLAGKVAPRALRVRVQIKGHSRVLTPWMPRDWTPGVAPAPTATPTITPTATITPTPTVTPTATAPVIPTAYPVAPLTSIWTWKALLPTLPLCPSPTATVAVAPTLTPTSALSATTATPAVSGTATMVATATPTPPLAVPPLASRQPTPAINLQPRDVLSATATITASPSVIAPTATQTPTIPATSAPPATATSTPSPTSAGPCDAGPPSPRQDYAAGWDNADHRLYIFGGTDSKTAASFNDLSSYSTITNAWTAITPAGPPPSPRYGAGAVWDPALSVLLVFGGVFGAGSSARFSNDLWEYAPSTNSWVNLSPNNPAALAPSPRAHAAVAWDPANNRLLVFGGQTNDNASSALTNDLWAYTFAGSTGSWSQLSRISGDQGLPPPRQAASIAWDEPAGVLRLFGGKNSGSGSLSDTWTWSPLSGWVYENVADQPAGRQAAGYFWDDTHSRFVVGPGLSMTGNSTDLWFFEPSAHDWQQIPVAASPTPAPRQMTRMVWDSADDQALMFGGRQGGAGASNDLWALIPTGAPAAAPTPAAESHLVKAVDIGQVVSATSDKVLLTQAKAQLIANSGAQYARVSFTIGAGRTSWTPARLHAYEQVITILEQHGVATLALAGAGITGGWTAANWTQNAYETTGGNGENSAIDDYVNQFTMLVRHFYAAPYQIRRWEVWNEPNVPLAGCTSFNITCLQQPALLPSNFAALLALAFHAVKTAAGISDTQIVSGGIFGHSIGGSYSAAASGAVYLAKTYDAGINKTGMWREVKAQTGSYPLDLVGEHIYVDQGQRTTPAVVHTYLNWFHNAYASYEGSGAKGTLITEAGWRTGDSNEPQVSPDIQALNLDTIFETARRSGYVKELCWFELQDDPGYLHNTSWGLLDRNGNPKPAFLRFQAQ